MRVTVERKPTAHVLRIPAIFLETERAVGARKCRHSGRPQSFREMSEPWTRASRKWIDASALPAHPYPPARAAEIAAVPPDHRVIAAFGAAHALHLRRGSWRGWLEHAHRLHWVAFFVQDAEHRVAVDDEARDVRHRRGPGLLLARTRRERHEVAERFGVVQQLAQFHSDPRRIDDAHVERQDLA